MNEALTDKQEMAVLLMVHKPEVPLAEIAKRVGIAYKTLMRWRQQEAFKESLTKARAIRQATVVATITESLDRNLSGLMDAAAIAAQEALGDVREARGILLKIAQDESVEAKERIAAAKEVHDFFNAIKTYEIASNSWTKLQSGGDGKPSGSGPGRGGGAASSLALDPDADPNRPLAPEPRPGITVPLSQEGRDRVLRFTQRLARQASDDAVNDESPEHESTHTKGSTLTQNNDAAHIQEGQPPGPTTPTR